MQHKLPTEGYLPFLDLTLEIHWDNHAYLMFGIWFVLVPAVILLLRFGKIAPRPYGIPRGTSKWAWPELPWTLHKYLLYFAVGLSLAGAAFAMVLTKGLSGTLHAWFGVATLSFGVLQILSSLLRGSHGGRKDPKADPEDRSTWGGDHFNMTGQRRWFEAYHKTAGYFAMFCAGCAVATGLAQYWVTGIAVIFSAILVGGLILSVVLQGKGHNHDTYQSVYGNHPEHPHNKARYNQMFRERETKP